MVKKFVFIHMRVNIHIRSGVLLVCIGSQTSCFDIFQKVNHIEKINIDISENIKAHLNKQIKVSLHSLLV